MLRWFGERWPGCLLGHRWLAVYCPKDRIVRVVCQRHPFVERERV